MDFNDYWDTQIEFYKTQRPFIYEKAGLMNLLRDQAYDAWLMRGNQKGD